MVTGGLCGVSRRALLWPSRRRLVASGSERRLGASTRERPRGSFVILVVLAVCPGVASETRIG